MTVTVRCLGSRRNLGRFVLVAIIGAMSFVQPSAAQVDGRGGAAVDIPADATVETLFGDFLHYARMGRFKAAEAFADALLAHPQLDPVEIVELAERDSKSIDTLLILVEKSSIGEGASRVLDLIERGEHEKRQDPGRIRANIENLGKGPQQEYFGTRHLADAGEYAIAPMIDTLLDTNKAELWPRVITALGKMGKPAVTPLATALAIRDDDVRLHLVKALGEIGYPHAVPHLLALAGDDRMPAETKRAAQEAVDRIAALTGRSVPTDAAGAMFALGESYFDENDVVRADPRLPNANVWYWDEVNQALSAVVVPQQIFGSVMAMRCCERVLNLQADHADAIALWLAANIRRESRLGMNTESGDPDEAGDPDATRPDAFPRALYFTQAAGAHYAHMVLGRAAKDLDAATALGAIEALRVTAGPQSLIGAEDLKQPLVQAMRFPDLIVRIRAALALGAALPQSPFAGAQYVVPVLAEAVALTGDEQVLVVDEDQANLNRVMDALRAGGRAVIGERDFARGLARARQEFPSLRAVVLSTGVASPGAAAALAQLRSEFTYARTPVILLTDSSEALLAEDLVSRDDCVGSVDADADGAAITAALTRVFERAQQTAFDDDFALSLALEAVETLGRIATDGRTVFDVRIAEPALVAALQSPDDKMRTSAAVVLASVPTPSAQQAIARMALESSNDAELRISAFDSLAESAKRHGSLLESEQVTGLVQAARDEADLTVRTGASQALGAVNLRSNQASEIIRSYSNE